MSKYVDTTAVMHVIGNIYNNVSLLDENDKYFFNEEDFVEPFHKILFGSIYNIHALGAKEINKQTIYDYLKEKPNKLAVYETNNGDEYIDKLISFINPLTFDYYYNRLKKFTLLRAFKNCGIDVSDFYDDDNILDIKKKQQQEEWLDNTSLDKIAEKIDDKIADVRLKYVDNFDDESVEMGHGIKELIIGLKKSPDVGIPLYGPLINTITRGARLGRFYLRSGATGGGKTRMMMADMCYIACSEMWDERFNGWISIGESFPAVFITTEQDLEQLQTMALAFISGVNEEHILYGAYLENEEERVLKAAEIISKAPLYVEELHDFSLQDVENCIRRNVRQHNAQYIAMDYIHSSIKILGEISSKAGIRLREDNILYMMSVKMKDICNEYGIFLISGTQLSGDFRDEKQPDQNLLRGAKSLADKIDVGMISLRITQEDLDSLSTLLSANLYETPTHKISVYKNRGGRYTAILMWCVADLGTCRMRPMFITDYNYKMLPIEDIKIKVDTEERNAF